MGLKFNTVLFDNMSIKNLKKGLKLQKNIMKQKLQEILILKQLKQLLKLELIEFLLEVLHIVPTAIDFKLEI